MSAKEHKAEREAAQDGTPPPAQPAGANGDPAAPGAAGPAGAPPQDGGADGGAGAAPPADAPPPPAGDPAAADDAAGEPDGDDGLDADLRELASKADEYLALAQRTQADFENFRKRMTRDVRAAEARGIGRLARELLPAIDNLERALAAVEASGSGDDQDLTKGIRLVQADLSSAFARAGIEGFAAKGERFDPVHHEAVAQQPVEGAEPGTIVEVLQSGYRLNDAVLRPARVVVAG